MQPFSRQTIRLSSGTELAFVAAGDPAAPALLLLHGFPSSSRTFSAVIPRLAGSAYVIAPDLPGFGASEPLAETSFAAMAEAVTELLQHLGVGPRFIYLHDFGAPVGLEIAMAAPDKVLGLIVQNANAHRSGQGPGWAETRKFWTDPTPENEAAATRHLNFAGTREQYIGGVPEEVAARIAPERWQEDWQVMQLPGRMAVQRALVRDYGRYSEKFDAIAAYLAARQPPALLLWGRHDIFFEIDEVLDWIKALPRMQAHILDGGHFLLETHAREAASLITDFIAPAKN